MMPPCARSAHKRATSAAVGCPRSTPCQLPDSAGQSATPDGSPMKSQFSGRAVVSEPLSPGLAEDGPGGKFPASSMAGSRSAAEGGGAGPASTAALGWGISTATPHLLHFPRFPANEAATTIRWPFGHSNVTGAGPIPADSAAGPGAEGRRWRTRVLASESFDMPHRKWRFRNGPILSLPHLQSLDAESPCSDTATSFPPLTGCRSSRRP